MIIKGISRGQNLEVTDRALTLIRAEGGMIEEATDEPEDDAGGEPESFVEKEKVSLDALAPEEVVVGSVSSVDLRARKEGLLPEQNTEEVESLM